MNNYKVENAQAIVNILNDSINFDCAKIYTDQELTYTNSLAQFKWDKIYTDLHKKIHLLEGYTPLKIDRKIWRLCAIYDEGTRTLMVVLKRKRYKELLKNHKNDRFHYVRAFALLNKHLEDYNTEPINFYEYLPEDKYIDTLNDILNDILQNYEYDIKKLGLILMDIDRSELINLTYIVPNSDLSQNCYEEEWGEFIKPSYEIDDNNLQNTLSTDSNGRYPLNISIDDDNNDLINKEDIKYDNIEKDDVKDE